MKLRIEYSPSYLRKARKIAKKNPQLKSLYAEVLEKLITDPFNPALHTHPLMGKLKGRYACSLTDDLRIVFKLSSRTLHLLNIGAHNEVY